MIHLKITHAPSHSRHNYSTTLTAVEITCPRRDYTHLMTNIIQGNLSSLIDRTMHIRASKDFSYGPSNFTHNKNLRVNSFLSCLFLFIHIAYNSTNAIMYQSGIMKTSFTDILNLLNKIQKEVFTTLFPFSSFNFLGSKSSKVNFGTHGTHDPATFSFFRILFFKRNSLKNNY